MIYSDATDQRHFDIIADCFVGCTAAAYGVMVGMVGTQLLHLKQ